PRRTVMTETPAPAADAQDLTGRICLVTGAAGGIGRGIATRLTAEGAAVVVADLDEGAARRTAEELGGRSLAVHVDITDRASVDAMTAQLMDRFGRIDVLVTTAGWAGVGPCLGPDPVPWGRVSAVNRYGSLHCSQSVVRVMTEQGHGTVVNIASDAAGVGSSGEAVYSACKGGIVAFTKTLARESARAGITANVVCPGPADTPLFASISEDSPKLRSALERAIPLRRLAQPEALANAVAFLA